MVEPPSKPPRAETFGTDFSFSYWPDRTFSARNQPKIRFRVNDSHGPAIAGGDRAA